MAAQASPLCNIVSIQSKRRSACKQARNGKPVFLTPKELLAVLRAARERTTRDFALILTAYLHGLRANEASNLALADVRADAKFQSGSIVIRRLKGSLETVQPPFPHKGEALLDEIKALRT
ncbi:MAG TPA: tyrosine-type recombinase/integrase [Candidatus Acidoferrales bacterium]|nr:tyrosine-type recombinase/integrase [Candidatus Acidoferrales bacterium]